MQDGLSSERERECESEGEGVILKKMSLESRSDKDSLNKRSSIFIITTLVGRTRYRHRVYSN